MAISEKQVNYGYFQTGGDQPLFDPADWNPFLHDYHCPLALTAHQGSFGIFPLNKVTGYSSEGGEGHFPMVGILPPLLPENLGSPEFRTRHRVKYAYVTGAMANGIGSEEIVIAMSRAGMLGFFGSGGLSLKRVEQAIHKIQEAVGEGPYGFNLLHNPFEPSIEQGTVDMYLKMGVHLVEAAAFLGLSPMVVQFRVTGLIRDSAGQVVAKNHVIAKVSRTEVARAFMSPPPEKMVEKLVAEGKITSEEAILAKEIPMAEDITAEADSGGHTDRRPFVTLIPTILNLRDEIQQEFKYKCKIRVGAAGGVSTPASLSAAFQMGADYVVTGTVNQISMEAGTSDSVREMLSRAQPHDVIMAPAADMFEMGVKLQVLKFGTMFAMRADKLFALYQSYKSIEEIPPSEKSSIEKQIFRKTLEEVWDETEAFFKERDPSQVEKAATNSKHKMALIFRWYLGKSSRWAISGEESRKMDYQVWCGPAMGSFNEWRKEGALKEWKSLGVVPIAYNLLRGATILNRVHFLHSLGIETDSGSTHIPPVHLEKI